ncbi:MAG TPA: PA2169 family four-helix-bundle protein [Terriglobales bacterium]|nr:PA2169 family four-helix-bundle protein [Terriglobales bacterium]
MDQNNAISVVENLIETCRDGEKGYQDAASHVKRTDLKTFFTEQGSQRARFADELQLELSKLGKPEKKESGSVGGAMHRAWIDTKVAMGGGDKTILESVEKGEDTAKESYQKAMNGALPGNVLEIVRRQASSVMNAHDRVRDLRDAA